MTKLAVIAACHDDFPIDLTTVRQALTTDCSLSTFDLPWSWPKDPTQIEGWRHLTGAAAILLRSGTLPGHVLSALPTLKIVACHGTGVDQVDVAAAKQYGIWVTNTPGANAVPVAHFALAAMLNLLRGLHTASEHLLRNHDWDGARIFGGDVVGRTIGLLGCGHVAQTLGRLCMSMGAHILATRRNENKPAPDGFEMVSLDELLAQADVVSVHVPLTDETRLLLNADRIAAMKPGALLMNTARGGIVDLDALDRALRSGHLAGAALDVFPTEPPDFSHPIFSAPNLLATPHMAASTPGALVTTARIAATDIARVLRGRRPLHPVKP